METAFILCTRVNSSRLHEKSLIEYNGITSIEHLVSRLLISKIPVILAIPQSDINKYSFLKKYEPYGLRFFVGSESNPLERMYNAASMNSVKNIIRVTHDKIFVDIDRIEEMLSIFKDNKLDYMFSSDFIPGSGFEILSFLCLKKAFEKFKSKQVEHISYVARFVSEKTYNFRIKDQPKDVRLLIDYQQDRQLIDTIFEFLSVNCMLSDVLNLIEENQWMKKINKLPVVTIYTCAYNAEKFLGRCIDSVLSQEGFDDFEYLMIDDSSSDATSKIIAMNSFTNKNCKWIKNKINLGLASSSNIALSMARGQYIIRLDADDFFTDRKSVKSLLNEIKRKGLEALYPDNYFGSWDRIQKGSDLHHIGGTMFESKAINFIKFTDGLRGLEGNDFFQRAEFSLKIGYYNRTTFFYTQRPDSMSKTNIEERTELQRKINNGDYK